VRIFISNRNIIFHHGASVTRVIKKEIHLNKIAIKRDRWHNRMEINNGRTDFRPSVNQKKNTNTDRNTTKTEVLNVTDGTI
jgi:hypothetical protein